MKFFLSIACLLALPTGFVAISTCAAQDDPILSFQGEQAVIPMPTTAGRHLVQVRIGDAGPYTFLIDTGSTISAIDAQLAKSLGLKIVGEILVGAPGGGASGSQPCVHAADYGGRSARRARGDGRA